MFSCRIIEYVVGDVVRKVAQVVSDFDFDVKVSVGHHVHMPRSFS